MSFFPSVPMGKKTPYYKYKEQEKHKKQREDDESAKVYQDFVESFEVHGKRDAGSEFVRGETLVHGTEPTAVPEKEKGQTITFHTDRIRKRTQTSAPAFLPIPSADSPPPAQVPSSTSKQKDHGALPRGDMPSRRADKHKPKHIDLMLEAIKRCSHVMVQMGQSMAKSVSRDQEARESRLRPRKSGFDTMAEKTLEMALNRSLDIGDSATTNLYVGNIAPDVNEEILKREFGRFGTVASVKIMWPRDEDQIKRGSNVGFVAFMDRSSAAKCIENLNGEKLHGMELRIGWGKSVPLPASAPTGSHSQERSVPTYAADAAVGIKGEELSDKEIEVSIPEDLHMRYVIDTLAAFVLKDGAKFEQLIRQREAQNPAFAFLFEDGTAANVYYRWKLFTLVQGDSMQRWRLEPFYLIEGGPRWKPPNMCMGDGSQLTAAQRGEGVLRRKLLSDLESQKFEEMLQNLKADKSSICDAMVFSLNNAEAAEEIVEILATSLCQMTTPVGQKIARLFVVSDVLHNSSASVRNASQYRTRIEEKLPDVFESFRAVRTSLHDKKDVQETVKKHKLVKRPYVLRILRTWRNWYVFSDDYLNGLQSTFLASDPSEEEMEQQMKKLRGMTEDDMERKCRFNGLSLQGGYRQQCIRYVRLKAYLHGTSNSTTTQKKSTKLAKPRKQQPLVPVSKRETTKPKKMTEVKTGGWVCVEQEKKPPVPISQWLQEKQQVTEKLPEKAVEPPRTAPRARTEDADFDMFEADDPSETTMPMEGVEPQGTSKLETSEDQHRQKRPRRDGSSQS